MTVANLFNRSLKQIKHNSPEILTGLGVAGVAITAYLAARAAHKASKVLYEIPPEVPTKERLKEQTALVWKFYIPPTLSGAATIACIIGSSKASGRRTAAAVTAYSLTEKAFSEYKEHVVEQIGKGKEQKIRDEIAQKNVTENPPTKEVLVLGSGGQVLCCELWTHRYFRSDMESLRKAENEINSRINNCYYVTLDEWYDEIGLPHTSTSDKLGWDSDKLLELQFSTVLSEEGEPCLAFEYNYLRPNSRSLLA